MKIKEINTDDIRKGYNPRLSFNIEKLKESIKTIGLLEPVILREIDSKKPHFEMISGEQRWEVFKQLKKKTIPAMIRKLTDEEASHIAYIDNEERKDFTPYERALHFAKMRDDFQLSKRALASKYNNSDGRIGEYWMIATIPYGPKMDHLSMQVLYQISKLVNQNKLIEILEEAFKKKEDKWNDKQRKEFNDEFKARQEKQIELGIQASEREWTVAETERQVKNQLYLFNEKDEYIKKSARQKLTQAISQFREGIDKITNSVVRSVDGFKAFKGVIGLFPPEILEQISEKDNKILIDELDTLESELNQLNIKDINADINWFRKNLKGG